eukprot:Nk52_evm21s2622 gene=Nk52_evmTU21s2622
MPIIVPKQNFSSRITQSSSQGEEGSLSHPSNLAQTGFAAKGDTLSYAHPVENIQKNHDKIEQETRLKLTSAGLGSDVAMRVQMERDLVQKHSMFQSTAAQSLGREILLGSDTTMDVKDVLNLPSDSVFGEDFHSKMERKMGWA